MRDLLGARLRLRARPAARVAARRRVVAPAGLRRMLPGRAGSNGRVSSSSDCASNSDSRVAGSTGLPAPSVRSKEEPYLSLAEFMTDRHSTFHMTAAEKGERLDRMLAQRVGPLALAPEGPDPGRRSDNRSERTIRDPGHRVNAGDAISVTIPPDAPAEPQGEDIPLTIVHEDDALIVIDKPKGLVVHPAAGNPSGTLVNALIAHCGASLSGIGGVKRPGIVHRLDKDTTGLMVVAKTDTRASRRCRRNSPTMAGPASSSGSIWPSCGARRTDRRARSTLRSTAIPRPATSRRSGQGGREAVTHWELLETYPGTDGKAGREPARLPAGDRPDPPDPGASRPYRPSAARRRHLWPRLQDQGGASAARTPARRSQALGRQALHAHILGFQHPETGETSCASSPACRTICAACAHYPLSGGATAARAPIAADPERIS